MFFAGLEWFNVSEPISFAKHLKGKVVVLDFFTYCCINCMHIIPDLREIENEFSAEDGLVVVRIVYTFEMPFFCTIVVLCKQIRRLKREKA